MAREERPMGGWGHDKPINSETIDIPNRPYRSERVSMTRYEYNKLQELTRSLEAIISARDAEIELLKAGRVTCLCGQDTAPIRYAQCYNCRQKLPQEIDSLRTQLADTRGSMSESNKCRHEILNRKDDPKLPAYCLVYECPICGVKFEVSQKAEEVSKYRNPHTLRCDY